MSLSFLGSVAQVIPDITEQFNRKYQENQLAIAQAEAREAEAIAAASRKNSSSGGNTMVYILVGVAVVAFAVIFSRLTRS